MTSASHLLAACAALLSGALGLTAVRQYAPVPPLDLATADAQRVGQPAEAALAAVGDLVDLVIPPGPGGTGTDAPEPIQYRLPVGYDATGERYPLLVAYHGFGSSAAAVAPQTALDEQCSLRGYLYLAVTGRDDKLFGTPPAQAHVEAALHFMLQRFHVDPDRLFLVGFSMGGGVVLNVAARRRDPAGLMFAGLGLVSATSDWTAAYASSPPELQLLMEHPLNFGAGPDADPFAYHAASGLVVQDGATQEALSMAVNLGATPIFLTWDLGDPLVQSATQNPRLFALLQALGGELQVKTVFNTIDPATGAPAPHSWAVLKPNALLDFFEGRRVERHPSQVRALLPEDARVSDLSLVQQQGGAFSAFTARLAPDFDLGGASNLAHVGFDAAGRAAALRLRLAAGATEGFALTLAGFSQRPSYLLAPDGSLLPDVHGLPAAGHFAEGATAAAPGTTAGAAGSAAAARVGDATGLAGQDALRLLLSPGAFVQAAMRHEPSWSASLRLARQPSGETRLQLVGPPQARRAWLVLGSDEVLVDVLGAALLGLDPRPPALVRQVVLDEAGRIELPVALASLRSLAGDHLHVQALCLDREGRPLAASNVARVELP